MTNTKPARRSFLRSVVAAVATATPAATAVALPVAAAALQTESPALLAIGKRLDEIGVAYDVAAAAEASAIAELERLTPALPPGLIADFHETTEVTRTLRTYKGEVVLRQGGLGAVQYYEAELLELWRDRNAIDGRTKVGRRLRHLIALARKHEAQVAEAERISDVGACSSVVSDLREETQDLFDKLVTMPPRSAVGVAIYARAILVGGKVLRYGRDLQTQLEGAGAGLAAALLRINAAKVVA